MSVDMTPELQAAILADPRSAGVVAQALNIHHNTVRKVRREHGVGEDGTRGAVTAAQVSVTENERQPTVRDKVLTPTNDNPAEVWAASAKADPEVQSARSETTLRERRRRKTGDPSLTNNRLVCDRSKFDPDYEYRWALDKPGRLKQLTEYDDWDFVDDAHMQSGAKGHVTAVAGANHYNAGGMFLLRKLKSHYAQDEAEKAAKVDASEAGIKAGVTPGPDGAVAVQLGKDPKNTPGRSGLYLKEASISRDR